MRFTRAKPEGLVIIDVERCKDTRGHFARTFCADEFIRNGLPAVFAQCSISFNHRRGTLRGLHFQAAPVGQNKLIRVARGRILDVAVDIRRSSPTFGLHVAVELSAENWRQLLIPVGFAHGFVTLEPDTEVLYKTTATYSAAHDRGLAWDDPEVGIKWPLPWGGPVLSDKDGRWPRLKEAQELFA